MFEAQDLIRSRIPAALIISLRDSESNGHGARGKVICQCLSEAIVSACSDVGGVWVNCPICGLIDF